MKKFALFSSPLILFISTYFLPLYFMLAFNFSKGIQNNSDGIMFIPVGFILIIMSFFINFFLIKKSVASIRSNKNKNIFLAVLIIAALAPIIINLKYWGNFFECLMFYKGFNLK